MPVAQGKQKRPKEVRPGFDEKGNILSDAKQEEALLALQANVDALSFGQQWGCIAVDNYLIPKEAVQTEQGKRVFDWKDISENELTLYTKDTHFAKRKRHGRKRTDGIDMFGENDKYYGVPVQWGIQRFGRPAQDNRYKGQPLPSHATWKGRALWKVGEGNYDQVPVASAVLKHVGRSGRGGMVEVPTASGKTNMVESILLDKTLGRKTLIVVPKGELVQQWIDSIERNITGLRVTVIQAGKIDRSGDVVIAMLHTLAKNKTFSPEYFADFGVVVFDELHKAAAKTLCKALPLVSKVAILLGFTATLHRTDEMEKLFPLFFGPLIYRGSPVTRGCAYVDVLPARFYVGNQVQLRKDTGERNVIGMVHALADDRLRDDLLLHTVGRCLKANRHTILFVELIQHAARLAVRAQALFPGKRIVHVKSGQTKAAKAERKYIYDNEHDVVIATSELLGTGVDITYIDTIIEGMPFKDEIQALQDSGRFRPPPGDWQPDTMRRILFHVVDMFDDFPSWWNNLKRIYKRKTYTILPAEEYRTVEWNSKENRVSNVLPT